MKKLFGIIISMMVLAVSCQMSSQEIEDEIVVEQPQPTNVDSKGNLEYAKAMMEIDYYDENYILQALFYETEDTFNEWKGSLAERYGTPRWTGLQSPMPYKWRESVYCSYNKVTVLVSNIDETPVGVMEYYIEGDSYYDVEQFDTSAHVWIKDVTNWAICWNKIN